MSVKKQTNIYKQKNPRITNSRTFVIQAQLSQKIHFMI